MRCSVLKLCIHGWIDAPFIFIYKYVWLSIAIYLLCEREMLMIASSRTQPRLPTQEAKQQNKLFLVLKVLPTLNWWHGNFLLKYERRDGWRCAGSLEQTPRLPNLCSLVSKSFILPRCGAKKEKETWELVNHQKVKAGVEAFAQLWDGNLSSSSRCALSWCYQTWLWGDRMFFSWTNEKKTKENKRGCQPTTLLKRWGHPSCSK